MNCHLPEEEPKINGNLQINLYDMNKQIISQMPTLKNEAVDKAIGVIKQYIEETEQTFYMMLCRDLNYYTLFHIVDYLTEPAAADEVIACASELGAIKSVERAENEGAVEIWFQPIDSEPVAMYLFGYDGGVIECVR